MLEELYLEDYVLFSRTTLTFGTGLNVISGETGSGKSLIGEALGLVLGGRATAGQIRAGANTAQISGIFTLPKKSLATITTALALTTPEENTLVFRRTLKREGASRLSVCGTPVSVQAVRAMSTELIDLAAQYEQTRLTDPAYQRELLDRFGGLGTAAAKYAKLFRQAQSLDARLRAGDAEREKNRHQLLDVRARLEELDALRYEETNDADLEDRIRALANAESVRATAGQAIELLYEADDSLHDQLGGLENAAAELAGVSADLADAGKKIADLLAHLEDAVECYRAAIQTVDCEPGALDEMVERAEALKHLARRLECTVEGLPAEETALRELEAELAAWETGGETLREDLTAALEKAVEAGEALRKRRGQAAKKLDRAVAAELRELGMVVAGFTTHSEPLWQEGDELDALLTHASAGGLDEISFRISPNPGEPAAVLASTASGGEASRTMLAIKAALAVVHCPPVIFFDEIDAGVGGRLGDVIGRKLAQLAQTRQVIAITHLPQIAARAARHWRVTKSVAKGRTTSQAELLDEESRVEEVAAMIHGEGRTETTRTQAREMLAQAQEG